MGEMIKMVVVLTLLSSLSGGLLAYVKEGTQERIENQVLQLVKGPAIKAIFSGSSNDPVADRFSLMDGDTKVDVFVAKFDGQTKAVAFETFGKGGYGGDVGLMVGIDVTNDQIYGMGVTTHSETAGLGARAKTDPKFTAQFAGMPINETFKVTADGGQVNALSGATITSRAVSLGATEAGERYERLKPQIEEQLKAFK
ncbi:MAG: RnfABCDGE type electron transport complex subunit G [Deltaproteobacteria bacterium]|jgi:electron transport complex protein RnfG|nr:RnfABCDGE type electron transport complex subunit G [Deltaproteobacteria bacterium]